MPRGFSLSQNGMRIFTLILIGFSALLIFLPMFAYASGDASDDKGDFNFELTLLWLSIILILAKTSNLIERFGQPAVLGELLVGVILGNLDLLGIEWFEPIKSHPTIIFLGELGMVVLFFLIGLESNTKSLLAVGKRAIIITGIAAFLPLIAGYFLVGPIFFSESSQNTHLFIGTVLLASSIGIVVSVFHQFNKSQTPEARIVLSAAMMDDVVGLVTVSVITAIIISGSVSLLIVAEKAFVAIAFIVMSVAVGQIMAPFIGTIFSKIYHGQSMKFALALSLGFIFSYLAGISNLASRMGAFIAGLFLDPVAFEHFDKPKILEDLEKQTKNFNRSEKESLHKTFETYSKKHVGELIEPLSYFTVPIFFVVLGMNVDLRLLADMPTILVAIAITAITVLCRMSAGLFAGKNVNKLIVGVSLVPQGEVGLAYIAMGLSLGVLDTKILSILVAVNIITTFVAPLALSYLLNPKDAHKKIGPFTPRFHTSPFRMLKRS